VCCVEEFRRDSVFTRRKLLGGIAASATVGFYPSPAPAFLAAVIEGIEALVALWEGYKMAKEIYHEFFANRAEPVTEEVARVYGPENFTINNYYSFGNSYGVAGLGNAEPGLQVSHQLNQNATSLCCSAQRRPVFLSTGGIVGLHAAQQQLSQSFGTDNVFAYTRPIRYVTPVEPWHEIDAFGNQLKSDVQYYSAAGSVALRWMITNRNMRSCRSEFLIRDDTSLRIVAQGVTSDFYY